MIKQKIYFGLFMALFLTQGCIAQDLEFDSEIFSDMNLTISYLTENRCEILDKYYKEMGNFTIPKNIPFKNENLHIYVNDMFIAELEISSGNLKNISCEKIKEASYEIYIQNYVVLLGFIENFEVEDLKEKLENQEIEIVAKGFWKKIKLFFGKLALKYFF